MDKNCTIKIVRGINSQKKKKKKIGRPNSNLDDKWKTKKSINI